MNYEITEQQIKELAKGNKKVEKMFPQVFQPFPEVGKWYKRINEKTLFFIESISGNWFKVYGFDCGGSWMNDENPQTIYSKTEILATDQEVQEALINEAKKRGFKKGVKFYSIASNNEFKMSNDDFLYQPDSKCLSAYNGCVFSKGKWAEPIKTKYLTKAQAENELKLLHADGYEYDIID